MNTFSEKQPNGPLLPLTNPITQDSTTSGPSRMDRFVATMESMSRAAEEWGDFSEKAAFVAMVVLQILCLGTVLVYAVSLAYLLATGHRTTSPDMALEIVCQTVPFLAIGTGVRFMELVTLLLRREKRLSRSQRTGEETEAGRDGCGEV
ncbi:hypothetical protein VE00_09343 [Pseudogymnoascus sp. WSF 3629]|nr:hypothetical protein VE00_09343 [Pseudogymnoascus sp. WSF 3629]